MLTWFESQNLKISMVYKFCAVTKIILFYVTNEISMDFAKLSYRPKQRCVSGICCGPVVILIIPTVRVGPAFLNDRWAENF